jgi:hypothetical protein
MFEKNLFEWVLQVELLAYRTIPNRAIPVRLKIFGLPKVRFGMVCEKIRFVKKKADAIVRK